MAENRISTGEPAAPPRRLRDYRLVIRLAVCVAVLAVCAIGGVLAVVWLPWPRQWQGLAACVAAGFAGLAFLFAPLFLGIRCRDCGRSSHTPREPRSAQPRRQASWKPRYP